MTRVLAIYWIPTRLLKSADRASQYIFLEYFILHLQLITISGRPHLEDNELVLGATHNLWGYNIRNDLHERHFFGCSPQK